MHVIPHYSSFVLYQNNHALFHVIFFLRKGLCSNTIYSTPTALIVVPFFIAKVKLTSSLNAVKKISDLIFIMSTFEEGNSVTAAKLKLSAQF